MRFYQHKSHGIIVLLSFMPHVSYLITLYNKAKFLPGVVAALAAQQGDFTREFVFVDDGSTDDTLTVLEKLIAEYALSAQVITQVNQGPAAAFNAGLAQCGGEWLKPVDGDDILLPDATMVLLTVANDCCTDMAFASMKLQGRYCHPGLVPRSGVEAGSLYSNKTKQLEIRIPGQARDDTVKGKAIQSLALCLKNAQTNPTIWLAKTAVVKSFGGCDLAVFIQDYSLELELARHGTWAQLDAKIMQQPEIAADRLSDNQAQTLHDVNFALLRFLQRYQQDLPATILKQSIKRAAKRAFNWARRRGTWQHVWQFLPIYFAAMLGGISIDAAVIEKLCKPFRQTAAIRLPQ